MKFSNYISHLPLPAWLLPVLLVIGCTSGEDEHEGHSHEAGQESEDHHEDESADEHEGHDHDEETSK